MLWTLIYDFYVIYIFGGYASDNSIHSTFLGSFISDGTQINTNIDTAYIPLTIYDDDAGALSQYINIGNYMSLIATIITMIIILIVIGHFIKKTFNLFGRII